MFPIIDLPGSPNDVSHTLPLTALCVVWPSLSLQIWYLASSWNVNPITDEVEETQFSERIDRYGAYVPTEWAFPPHDFSNTRR